MLSGRPYHNKDIQLQVTKCNIEGPLNIITSTSTQNKKNWDEMKQVYHTNKNKVITPTKNTEHMSQCVIPNSHSISFWAKTKKIIFSKPPYSNFEYVKWLLIVIFCCTCVSFFVYTSTYGMNIKQVLPNSNSSYTSLNNSFTKGIILNNTTPLEYLIDSKMLTHNENIRDTFFKGSSTILKPIKGPHLTELQFIQETNSAENIESISYDKGISEIELNREFGDEQIFQQENRDKSKALSLQVIISGHQNNVGIPIEKNEGISKFLNSNVFELNLQTEPTKKNSPTESSLIVSPTLPLILHRSEESSTRSGFLEETQCQSTSLHMCREVLQYDLTTAKHKNISFTPLELNSFERLFISNCSSRAPEFVCSILEPECRPMQTKSLQPCKRYCKSVLEACSALVFTSDILAYIFDCDKYPDSGNSTVCEDPSRRGPCHENEFKCYDLSCIPTKWLCDNIKDCEDGDDEINCLICNTNEFRCKSNEKCIPDLNRCDFKEDCSDGSDERDCIPELENEPMHFSTFNSLHPNYTTNNLFNNIFEDDRFPAESEVKESVFMVKTDLADTTPNSTYLSNLKIQDEQEIEKAHDTEKNYNVSEKDPSGKQNKTGIISSISCIQDQLRCVSGKCITVNQICDRVVDCPEGEDELMCAYGKAPPTKHQP